MNSLSWTDQRLKGLATQATKTSLECSLLDFGEPKTFICKTLIKLDSLGAIHSTKIPTGPTGKRRPPQKVDPFFRNFSGWTEPILWVLDRNFRKVWLNGSPPPTPPISWLALVSRFHFLSTFSFTKFNVLSLQFILSLLCVSTSR